MTHPAKAHNVVAALTEMYGEAVSELLQTERQLRAKIKQVEAERDQLQSIIRTGRADNERLAIELGVERSRVADLEAALRTARRGQVHEADCGQTDGAAGAAEDRDEVRELRGDVADAVLDGTGEAAHQQLRDGASAQGPDDADAASAPPMKQKKPRWLRKRR